MIINLTPHPIRVRCVADASSTALESDKLIPASGAVARVAATTVTAGSADGVAISATIFGAVDGLPARKRGVTLLTSTLVAQAAKRADVVSPLTDGTAIRDDQGRVFAVRGFQTFARVKASK